MMSLVQYISDDMFCRKLLLFYALLSLRSSYSWQGVVFGLMRLLQCYNFCYHCSTVVIAAAMKISE